MWIGRPLDAWIPGLLTPPPNCPKRVFLDEIIVFFWIIFR